MHGCQVVQGPRVRVRRALVVNAAQVHQQAQEMMKTPGMAHAFMNMQSRMQDPDMLEKYQVLKDDPELKGARPSSSSSGCAQAGAHKQRAASHQEPRRAACSRSDL